MLVLSKADLVTAERAGELREQWQRRLGPAVPVIATSSATGEGVGELATELLRRVETLQAVADGGAPSEQPRTRAASSAAAGELSSGARSSLAGRRAAGDRGEGEEELVEHMVFRPAAGSGFQVQRIGPRSFAVRGRGIERLLQRYDVENADAMAYLEGRLRRLGVLRALEGEGFQPGDEIEIAGVAFELDPR
jgi:GTP-binding protein